MSAKKIVFPLFGQPKDRQRKTKYGHICFWAKNGNMGFVRFDKSGELIDKGFLCSCDMANQIYCANDLIEINKNTAGVFEYKTLDNMLSDIKG